MKLCQQLQRAAHNKYAWPLRIAYMGKQAYPPTKVNTYQAFLYCSSWGSPNTLMGHLGAYSDGVLLLTVLALPNSLISS
jgi:hypothetical protein